MTAATGNVGEMNERKEEVREGGGGGAEMRPYIALLLIDSVKSCRELGLMTVCVRVCTSVLFRAYCTPGIGNRAQRQHCILKTQAFRLYPRPLLLFPFSGVFLSGCKKMRRFRKQGGVLY